MIRLKNFYKEFKIEAGVDEAGRGCLAGPVVAAAVILEKDFYHPALNDSKQINEKNRNILREVIEKQAIAYGVGIVDNTDIDKYNILKSTFMAMHKALDLLKLRPEFVIIDGNQFVPYQSLPFKCIVKGDAKYTSIAAASVLAKTYRDEIMLKLHGEFPQYNWKQNKGYPTKAHKQAIEEFGVSPHHRTSFKLFSNEEQLSFDF